MTHEDDASPIITVIVPVRNEERFIAGTLGQLMGQDYPSDRFEVLVVDGRSTDATRAVVGELLADHPNLRLLDNPGRLSSAARNIGVRQARGELIVVVDGHCQLPGPSYLRNLADAFARSGADCLGRPQPLDVTGATSLQRAIAEARSSRLGHHPASFIYSSEESFVPPQSVAIAYRRSVFDTVGYFDERYDACEDVEFNHRVDRAGLRCFFTPRITVHYHPRASLRGLLRQMIRYGRGRVRLFRKHPETFSISCLIPAVFVAGLVLGPLLAWLVPWLWPVYLAAIGTYALAVLVATIGVAQKPGGWRLAPWLPLVYLTIHCGAGLGVLRELVARARPRGVEVRCAGELH
jgi:succinoglycan biosynthesis protein ExoA